MRKVSVADTWQDLFLTNDTIPVQFTVKNHEWIAHSSAHCIFNRILLWPEITTYCQQTQFCRMNLSWLSQLEYPHYP